ncbi:MAG: hypothetical protein K0U86_23860 [Planctomycetes bacterium]|nr:hypothetical protein [Planctomycetota bacterium]MCH9727950.1 hypothetical protein [Planctomycetota bacterium]MCH9778385.1 hypothetical protein [Planctomycetota bacterium]MCH9791925.1 hypothetical protein [Planctomycetota bacterium]
MDVTTFQCPQCQTVLRLRGKRLTDSTFPCPDCNQLLQLSQTAEGSTEISLMTAAPAEKADSPHSLKAGSWLQTLRRGCRSLTSNPVLISWIVAGSGAVLILLMLVIDHNSSDKTTTLNQTATVTETPAPLPSETVNLEPPDIKEQQPAVPALPEPEPIVRAKPAPPPLPIVDQEIVAVKPEHTPALIAQKPQPAALVSPETDVTVALQIPIIEFRQPEAIPLKKLIRQLEEMLDTKFQVAENIKSDSRLLDTPISFSLKNTTLSILLKQILSKAALTFTVKSNKIHIQRVEAL